MNKSFAAGFIAFSMDRCECALQKSIEYKEASERTRGLIEDLEDEIPKELIPLLRRVEEAVASEQAKAEEACYLQGMRDFAQLLMGNTGME